jgi:hypothetical protein
MVMGMVGARGKAGIGEVETMDIERLIELVHGERSKWLWFGKPRKTMGNDMFSNLVGEDGMVFGKDEQGGYVWSSKKGFCDGRVAASCVISIAFTCDQLPVRK